MKKLIIFIILLMVLSGCKSNTIEPNISYVEAENSTISSSSVSIPEEQPTVREKEPVPPEKFNYEDFLKDYDYFWETLDDNYPFYNIAIRIGYNLDEIRIEWRDKIDETTTLADFNELMADMVIEFGGTGHMQFFGSANAYESYLLTYPPENYGHMGYLAKKMREPQTVSTYQYLFPEIKNESEADNRNESYSNNNFDNVTAEILKDGEIAYVKVNSFGFEYIEADSKVLIPFFKTVEDYAHIIIDLRGNGGGSDDYWRNNLVYPLLNRPISVETLLLFNNTPLIKEYIDTNGLFEMSVAISEIGNLPNLNNDDKEILTHVCISTSEILQEYLDSNFSGKVWLLVYGQVYSSSESFTMACKSSCFAIIVGTNTGGDGAGIDPMIFSLPNTELLWRNSIFYSINPDGSNNEEFGTTPDVVIDKGQDALEICLQSIEDSIKSTGKFNIYFKRKSSWQSVC